MFATTPSSFVCLLPYRILYLVKAHYFGSDAELSCGQEKALLWTGAVFGCLLNLNSVSNGTYSFNVVKPRFRLNGLKGREGSMHGKSCESPKYILNPLCELPRTPEMFEVSPNIF